MDILICAALLLIAGCMLFGKPIKLQIVHKHITDQTQDTLIPIPEVEEDSKDKTKAELRSITEAMQDMLGVLDDAE